MKVKMSGSVKILLYLSVLTVITGVVLFTICKLDNVEAIVLEDKTVEISHPKKDVKSLPTTLHKSINFCKEDYAKDIAHAVNRASKKYKIPHYVCYALIATESGRARTADMTISNVMNVNNRAKSHANCYGLTQVSQAALTDYNYTFGTNYQLTDLYDIDISIDVGMWHFNRYRDYVSTWTELYVIYNVGYGGFTRNNPYWYYDAEGNWDNNKPNSFFYMNGLLPPEESFTNGLVGKNQLSGFAPKKRFEKCLSLCYTYFNN